MAGCSGVVSGTSSPNPGPTPAPTIAVLPSSIAFGNVTVGVTSTQTVTVSNGGNADLSITQATVTGAGFRLSGITVPLTVAAGTSSNFTVTFAPTVTGSVSGTLSLTSNAAGSPTTVPVSGSGVATPTPAISVVPSSIAFGNVAVGVTNTQTVTVSNSGNADLIISQATVTGAGFSLSGITVPLTVAAGRSSNFNVAFAPTVTGSVSGTLSLTSNAPGSPTTVPVSGSGVQNHTVALSWTASTSTVAGYYVYRGSQTGGPYVRVNTTPVTLTSYSDANLPGGQTVYYAVTAVDASNVESLYSNEVAAVLP